MTDVAAESRAVVRTIEPGPHPDCAWCRERISFTAKDRKKVQVIANIYRDGKWDRVEHFHAPDCYDAAGRPYGDAVVPAPRSPLSASAPAVVVEAHQLTTLGAVLDNGERAIRGMCRCADWELVDVSQDRIAEAFDAHVRAADPTLF